MPLKTAIALTLAIVSSSAAWAQQDKPKSTRDADEEQAVIANENRTPAGKLENGLLTLHLVMAQGKWYPEADGREPSLDVPVFGEDNGPLTNPGPLIRVPEGTRLHVSVRNAYQKTLFVHGLGEAAGKASVKVGPGETHDFRVQKWPRRNVLVLGEPR
jgi:hypothetical protein